MSRTPSRQWALRSIIGIALLVLLPQVATAQGGCLTAFQDFSNRQLFTVTFTNNCATAYPVGVATYKAFHQITTNPPSVAQLHQQVLFDFQTATLSPGQHITLQAMRPSCNFQEDAFFGALIPSFSAPSSDKYDYRFLLGNLFNVGRTCDSGCTLTPGYWKNHAGDASGSNGNQVDAVTPLLPVWLGDPNGANSVKVTDAAQAVAILSYSYNGGSANNPVSKLYRNLLAARLNLRSGADGTLIANTIVLADAFLATHDQNSPLTPQQQQLVLSWATLFDNFNNGRVVNGPSHCS